MKELTLLEINSICGYGSIYNKIFGDVSNIRQGSSNLVIDSIGLTQCLCESRYGALYPIYAALSITFTCLGWRENVFPGRGFFIAQTYMILSKMYSKIKQC